MTMRSLASVVRIALLTLVAVAAAFVVIGILLVEAGVL
jgi:hypothetical protein